jgi:antitoxin CptB
MGDYNLETRRRRCLYRAQHRGTKEMDWLLGRYAGAVLPPADESTVAFWERLVELPDPQLYDWIMGVETAGDQRTAAVVMSIRHFHGLKSSSTTG